MLNPFCCFNKNTAHYCHGSEYFRKYRNDKIFWSGKNEKGGCAEIPISSEDCEQILHDAHDAPFGMGKKAVLDSTFRKAYKIESGDYSTTLELEEFNIPEKIKQALMPDATDFVL